MNNQYLFKIASTPEEFAALKRIRRLVFIDEQKIPAHLDDDGEDDNACHAICLSGEEVIATGRLVITEPGKGVLARIAVMPVHRGAGLGQGIVHQLERVALEKGIQQLTLHPHAYLEKFYKDLDYEKIPGTSKVGEHDLIIMKKVLLTD